MPEPKEPDDRVRALAWDNRISAGAIANIIQVVALIAGGLFALGSVDAKIDAVVQRMDRIEETVNVLGSNFAQTVDRLDGRIDRLSDKQQH